MKDKTCIVTGASQGIGKVTAIALAKLGARLVLVCRDPGRAESALGDIRAAAPGTQAEVLLGDLSVLADIRRVAEEFKRRHARLDVLVNNAGAIIMEHRVTPDGFEATFATNHLNYFLLTLSLLDVLKASAPARIVNVSSAGHKLGRIDFDDLQKERTRYSGLHAYTDSKLANILFTRELARRLDGTGVTVNCLHPGSIASNFAMGERSWFGTLAKIGRPFLMSEEKGAATSIYLASSPEVKDLTGRYFTKCREVKPSRRAQDDAAARRLWDVSEKLVGLGVPG